ncbi:hypothetical protein [Halobacteriovorax sp.]|uniref:hypothetical protein n=1 Tax=Halobacteriovorax sp. TaxID=2020862 RepID=UPI0035698B52
MKQNGIWNIFKVIFIVSILTIASSCVESGSGNKRTGTADSTTSDGATTEPTSPDFTSSSNFFQEGSTQSETGITIPVSFNDRFYLRGAQVDYYIKNGNKTSSKCLVFSYTSGTNAYLVTTATPQYFYNFSTNTQEYYYLISPGDESMNRTFCQSPGVQTTLSGLDTIKSIVYSLTEVCPTCSAGLFQSSQTQLLSDAGNIVTDVDTDALQLIFSNTSSNPGDVNISCTSSSTCSVQGYDCCVEGQCVNDKAIRNDVDTSDTDYLAALAAVNLDPTTYGRYPQYFYMCPIVVTPDPDVTPITDPAATAQERLEYLYELYKCTTPQLGEVSYCTKTVENISAKSSTVLTLEDDRNFNTDYYGTAGLPNHSIHEITYAGLEYFADDTYVRSGITIGPNGDLTGNDTLTDSQQVNFNITTPETNDTLKVTYKIDGSCALVGTTLAKCDKYYVQGQDSGLPSDHFPASQKFYLPYYADATRTIAVNVDDSIVQNGTDWVATISSPSFVEFQDSFQIFDTQVIKITYYVDLDAYPVLNSKLEAQEAVSEMCECPDLTCSLEPVFATDSTLVQDFICSYPQPDTSEPPLQQTVLLSSKTVPVRFFDADGGVEHQDVTTDTPEQEGLKFEYTGGDLGKPNNVDSYVGFNEIYGSITGESGAAKEAKEVSVTKGKTYDIFVNTGTFSSCYYCGTDYFSSLAKIFPSNFIFKGGGYFPDPYATDPESSEIRAHDLKFGRACFVPATMLPFSHVPQADRQLQRQDRMATQHFYFANGYQRDWYGFDYGSVIGSFDGVTWFSVGNQRRIKATTNKLFLAINAYYGDVTLESTYSVDVSDASTTSNSGSFVQSDYESDGAQCQKYHACDTDSDCASTLGFDYVCANVNSMQTPWPVFDQNAKEIPGQQNFLRMIAINGTTSGPSKRCVYRDQGSACQENYNNIVNAADTFNKTDNSKLFSCSANTYCQAFTSPEKKAKFNTKISRYAKSAKSLVALEILDPEVDDTFGFSTKTLGRPYNYNGTDVISDQVLTSVEQLNVDGMCIPGKNIDAQIVENQNSTEPDLVHLGDKVNALGMTSSELNLAQPNYLSSCPVLDQSGNYIQYSSDAQLSNTDSTIKALAGSQNVSTNSLATFNSIAELSKDFDVEYINTKTLQNNRCLRAPGASCSNNFECAANKYITDKTLSISSGSEVGVLDSELSFWKSTLVCSQETAKTDESYDPKNNRCCRLIGNTIKISNEIYNDTSSPDTSSIPGVDIPINDPRRYTAIAPAIDDMALDSSNYPQLKIAETDGLNRDSTELKKQFNTLNEVAQRTCCSANWVRNFDSSNGGGHTWAPSKMQTIDKTNFKCLNWAPGAQSGYTCSSTDEPDDPDCNMRSISSTEANIYLDWFAKFELLGVGQVAIEDSSDTTLRCSVSSSNSSVSGAAETIPGFVNNGATTEYDNNKLASTDANNFSSKKQIFSEDEFTCCQPLGTEMEEGSDPSYCCSGNINPDTNKCALKNYTNLSVFFNRYISSEAKGLSANLIDDDTGYIKSASTVQQLACQIDACASGFVGYGIAHTDLKVPGHESSDKQVKRFIDGNDLSNDFNGKAQIFNEGLRWNNQVYCIPEELAQSSGDVLQIFDCGSN